MAWTESPLKRAYTCNGEQLLYFRQQKGWTQKELASAAGYSERLINKAESGHSVSADSINDLAGALNSPENPVFPEDLICDPLLFAKQYIAALYTRQTDMFQVIRHFLDDEIVFILSGDPAIIPFAGEHRGLENVERLCTLFHSVMVVPEGHDYEPHYSYIVQGNDVMICGDSYMHPVGVPMEKPMRIFNRMKFRKGKLYLFEDMFDTQFGTELFAKYSK